MNIILKNILAVVAGWLIGSTINMGLIQLGSSVFPIAGVDLNDMEALAAVMPSLPNKHFIFPLLGHALGTLIGAVIAALIAATHKMKFALAIGILFLLGGIAVNYMLSGPTWFTVTDIALAYIPMAFLGAKLAQSFSKK